MGNGSITLTHSTVAFNTAAGGAGAVAMEGPEDIVTLENTLLVQTSASEIACNQVADSSVASLATDDSCTGVATDAVDIDLAALADNDGPTWTHALGAGGVAINAADGDFCTEHDQRGVPRPQGQACDIGAFEVREQQPDTLFQDRFESQAGTVPPG